MERLLTRLFAVLAVLALLSVAAPAQAAGRLVFHRYSQPVVVVGDSIVEDVGLKTYSGYDCIPTNELTGSAITGTGNADWVIDAFSCLVPSGTYATPNKSFSKTDGQTYDLTLASGRQAHLTMRANMYTISAKPGDTISNAQLTVIVSKAYNASGSAKLGDTIWVRPGQQPILRFRPPVGGYGGAGTIVAGSGYSGGPYDNVALTCVSGTCGTGALGKITISGGGVGNVHIQNPGTLAGGWGYTTGTYTSISLTGSNTGSGAVGTVTVAGGKVTHVEITSAGSGYAIGDMLTADASVLGGTGEGFMIRLTAAGGVTNAGYLAGAVLSAASGDIGGGSNFTFTVIDLNGRITIRSRENTSTDSDGNPRRGGDANLIAGALDAVTSGDLLFPFDFNYVDFRWTANSTHTLGLGYNSGNGGYGVSCYRCRFENEISAVWPITLQTNRQQTAFTSFRGGVMRESAFVGLANGISGSSSVKSGMTTTIAGNDFHDVSNDGMTLGGTGYYVSNNLCFRGIFRAGNHADCVQHGGFRSQGSATQPFLGYFLKTINARDASIGGPGPDCPSVGKTCPNNGGYQGISLFADNSYIPPPTGPIGIDVTINGVVSMWNGTNDTYGSVLWFENFINPIAKGNAAYAAINGAGLFTTVLTPVLTAFSAAGTGSGGTFTHNVAGSFNIGGQSGTTSSNNVTLAKTLPAYTAAITNATVVTNGAPITSRAAFAAANAPIAGVTVASGGLMNPDGTYAGQFMPPNNYGEICWNTFATFDPAAHCATVQ